MSKKRPHLKRVKRALSVSTILLCSFQLSLADVLANTQVVRGRNGQIIFQNHNPLIEKFKQFKIKLFSPTEKECPKETAQETTEEASQNTTKETAERIDFPAPRIPRQISVAGDGERIDFTAPRTRARTSVVGDTAKMVVPYDPDRVDDIDSALSTPNEILPHKEEKTWEQKEKHRKFSKLFGQVKTCKAEGGVANKRIAELIDYEKKTLLKSRKRKLLNSDDNIDKPEPFVFEKDQEMQTLYKEALSHKAEAHRYVNNLNHEYLYIKQVIMSYLFNVALPMRDLFTLKYNYTDNEESYDHLLDQLLISFPGVVVSVGAEKDRILRGEFPHPYNREYARFVEDSSGQSRIVNLRYNRTEMVLRDAITLLKVPTIKHHTMAMKWLTINEMLHHISSYNIITKGDPAVETPVSCRNSANGHQPEIANSKTTGADNSIYAVKKKLALDKLLTEYNLITDKHGSYYSRTGDNRPLSLFEMVKTAQAGLDSKKRLLGIGIVPDIDDTFAYASALKFQKYKIQDIYEFRNPLIPILKEEKEEKKKVKYYIEYSDIELFNSIVQSPIDANPEIKEYRETADTKKEVILYETITSDGNLEYIEYIDTSEQNLSVYLAQKMQRASALELDEIISDHIRQKYNSKIKLDFPSLYGSPAWRYTAFSMLAEAASGIKENSKPHIILQEVCAKEMGRNSEVRSLCTGSADEVLINLKTKLAPILENERRAKYQFNTKMYSEVHPLLKKLWSRLRDETDILQDASMREIDFLIEQTKQNNHWARTRLSYIVLLEDLKHKQDQNKNNDSSFSLSGLKKILSKKWAEHQNQTKEYWQHRMDIAQGKKESKAYKENNTIEDIIDRLERAGKVLKIDRPISLSHGNTLLSAKDKKKLWEKMLLVANSESLQIPSTRYGDKTILEHLEGIRDSFLPTKESVKKYVSAHFPYGISDSTEASLEELFTPKETWKEIVQKTFDEKGHTDTQLSLVQENQSELSTSNISSVEESLSEYDRKAKEILMRQILVNGAVSKRTEMLKLLNTMCNLSIDNEHQMKAILNSSRGAAMEIQDAVEDSEQMLGILEKARKEFDMLGDEWKAARMAGTTIILWVGTALSASLCTFSTAGICAPLGYALLGTATATLWYQFKLLATELSMKRHADHYKGIVERMQSNGFSESNCDKIDSTEEMDRSYFWSAIEVAFLVPIIGPVARGMRIGGESLYASGKIVTRHATRGESTNLWQELKTASQNVYLKEDISMAKRVLEMDSGVFNTSGSKLKNLKNTPTGLSKGNASVDTLNKLVKADSFSDIDSHLAKTVAYYFDNNPRNFLDLMRYYKKVLQKPKESDITRGFRFGHIYDHADKVTLMEKKLSKVVAENGDLETFVRTNIEDLTDIFFKVPIRKRDLVHLVSYEGGPYLGPRASKKLGALSWETSSSNTMKKMFMARSRLVVERSRHIARKTLGIPESQMSNLSFYDTFREFRVSVHSASKKLGKSESEELLHGYRNFEMVMAEHIFHNSAITKNKELVKKLRLVTDDLTDEATDLLKREKMRDILFNPKNPLEETLARAIWDFVPAKEILAKGINSDIPHRMVKQLSDYRSASEFARYLNALKVLSVRIPQQVVDFF